MKRDWYPEFRDKLKNREKKSAPRVRKLMRSAYEGVADAYSHSKPAAEVAVEFLSELEVQDIYRQIYKDIYIGMGRWNASKYLTSKSPLTDLVDYLTGEAFRIADLQSFLKRGLITSANRLAIIKVIEKLRIDPDFIALNEAGAKKVLMKQFRNLSKNQAAMIVRTEATNAANRALLDSTKRLFPGIALRKEWVSAKDNRTRSAHRVANGQRVLESAQFFVGGEFLDHPGAGTKAENNIYCRCAVIPVRNG